MPYGKELILDIHNCQMRKFERKMLKKFFKKLCKKIKMKKEDLYFWDYQDSPKEYKKAPAHLKGTTAVQFIQTSNITIHTLDDLKQVYLNIFSCKEFNTDEVISFCCNYFKGIIVNQIEVSRL